MSLFRPLQWVKYTSHENLIDYLQLSYKTWYLYFLIAKLYLNLNLLKQQFLKRSALTPW